MATNNVIYCVDCWNEKKLLESLAVFHELLVLILFATWKSVEWASAQQLSKIYRNLYLIFRMNLDQLLRKRIVERVCS